MPQVETFTERELKISEVAAIEMRLEAVGAKLPDGICILPSNYDVADSTSPLLYPAHTLDVKALAHEKNLPLNVLYSESGRIRFVENRDDTWVAPVMFFSALLLSNNPNIVGIALNVLSNYIYDFLKGSTGSKNVRLSFVMEKTDKKTAIKFDFDGSAENLPNVEKVIKGLLKSGGK